MLLVDTLSRLIKLGSARVIPDLDIDIALVLKAEPTRLKSLQEETKADITLAALTDLIITGWPQDLTEDLDQYLCFRDELTILDGLVMEGKQSCNSFKYGAPNRLYDAHHGLTLTLQRVRRTLYWPKLQDDITEIVQTCRGDHCQRYGNNKPRIPEGQTSATRPMEILRMDLVEYQGQRALATVHYFVWFSRL